MAIYERMTLKPRAGRLPEYSRQTENYVPGQGVSARVDDSAARIAGAGQEAEARALGHLGGVVQNVAGNLMAAYDDYSKSKAVELITKYRRIMNDNLYGEGGILTQQGEDAFNADGQREAKARQLRGELMKDAGERTKHYFTLQADEYDADSSLRAQKYARDERLKWMDRNNDAAAEERANAALLAYDDPESFNKAVAETLWNVRQKLERQGYSEEAIQHGLKETSSKLFRAAVQQALSNGDIWEAERILGHGNGAASKPGTTSANNLAAFNYGNVRTKSGGFAAYASRNDGLMAIGDRVLRYNNAPDRGWHAQTLREFTEIYAPIPKELKDAQKTIEFFQAVQKDGGKLTAEQEKAYEDAIKTIAEAKKKDPEAMNNPANYAAFLGKRLGLDPDARINFRDPEILAGMIQSIPIMEHGRGVNIGREEAVRAAQALLGGQKPRVTGVAKAATENAIQGPQGGTGNVPEGDGLHMTAPDMAWAREAIERKREAMAVEAERAAAKAQEEADKQFVLDTSADVLKQINDLEGSGGWTEEQYKAKVLELTEGIEDRDQRRRVRVLVEDELGNQAVKRKAKILDELTLVDNIFQQNPEMTNTQKLAFIRDSKMSSEAKAMAEGSLMKGIEGKENKTASAVGLTMYRQWFDENGGKVSPEEARAVMYDLGLNAEDRKKAAEYEGVALSYPQEHIFALIDKVFGKGKVDAEEKNRIFEAVLAKAKSGKELSDKELREIIYRQRQEGYIEGVKGFFGGKKTVTLGEAQSKGNAGMFRPDVPEGTAIQIKRRYEQEHPWFTRLDEATRDVLVRCKYLEDYFGIRPALTTEQRAAVRAAQQKYQRALEAKKSGGQVR